LPINFDHTGNLLVTNDGLLTFEITGAARLPIGTTAQRPASPLSGMIRYNTSLATFEGYTSSWQDLLAGGGGGGGASVTVSDTAPVGPADGDLWYNTIDPVGMFMWYDDSSVWIMVAGAALVIDEAEFNAMFDTQLATKTTTDLAEGTNLYFTDERVDDRVSNLIVAGVNIAVTYDDLGNTLTIDATMPTGAGGDQIFWENGQTVTTDYTITNNKNAMSAGPITINSGVTVTVGTGEAWAIV
jgi:hypothetical protein